MKKSLFLYAIAALSLASCAENEPVEINNGDAISFRTGIASRATETTNANLNSIYVTGFIGNETYFENLNFIKGSDNFFTSTPSYNWIGDNESISFVAYSPSMDALGADITIDKSGAAPVMSLESYVTPDSIADQVDFITANAVGTRKANEASGLELTFDHRLAQIELRAKTDNKTYTYEITGMRIGRAETTGTYNFSTNTWTLDDWHDTAIYESHCPSVKLGSTAVNIMGPSGNAMLIPQSLTPWSPKNDPDNVARGAYISVLLRITTTDGGVQIYPFPDDNRGVQYAWASIPLSGKWDAGKKYIYTLDFTDGAGNVDPDDPQPGTPVLGGPIKFTVNVNNWDDSELPTPYTPDLTGPTYK